MSTLITGGAGFIGSTIASACIERGVTPIILDDLSTGSADHLLGRHSYRGDIADGGLIDRIFDEHPDVDSAIHCAAKVDVPTSVDHPLFYFRNNVSKTIELVEHLLRNGCSRLLFSSSAAVYAAGPDFSVDEQSPLAPVSPYATSKLMVESVLEAVAAASSLRVLSLRYFNPVGVDPLMRTGPRMPAPTHVTARLLQAWESGEPFTITGVDWPTRDGSAIRDYVHVWDLARAHVDALLRFGPLFEAGERHQVINLGTGTGTTVRELVSAFQSIVGRWADIHESDPRPGDTVGSYARIDRALRLLDWTAQLTIYDAIRHSLEWRRLRSDAMAAGVVSAVIRP